MTHSLIIMMACRAPEADSDSHDSEDTDTANDSGTMDTDVGEDSGTTDTGPTTYPGTPVVFQLIDGRDEWGAQGPDASCDTIFAELLRSDADVDAYVVESGIWPSEFTDRLAGRVDWSINTVMPYYMDCNQVWHTVTIDAVQLLEPTRVGVWGTITHPHEGGDTLARIWGLALLELSCPDCTIDPADITETEIQLE